MDSSAPNIYALSFIQSRCGGRQQPDKMSAQPGPPAGCADFEAGVSRRAQPDCMRATAPSSAEGQRHALGVVAARGVRTWCWSFFCWLTLSHGLAQVCLHQGGTFRCAATPCTSALTGMLTRACCALLVRLGDHSKHSSMSLSHP